MTGNHPRVHACGLCGRRYAALESTWHISPSYRVRFCKDCTVIMEAFIRKLKKTMRETTYDVNH